MFLLSMSASNRSETGCMWRPLTAEVVPSVSQLASANAAASAADAKSARNKGRRFNRKLPPPARLPQASGPIAIRKTPTAGRRMADRAYRWVKRDNFVLEATPTRSEEHTSE